MADTVEDLTLLEQLQAKRSQKLNEIGTLAEQRIAARDAFKARENSENEKPTDEDRSAFNVAEEQYQTDYDQRDTELRSLERRISEETVLEQRRRDAAEASRASVSASVTREPSTYRKDNADKVSYFRDLAARYHSSFASQFDDSQGAMDRLERHGKEMNDQLVTRAHKRDQDAERRIERAEIEFRGSVGAHRRGFDASPFERRVNPNRTDGQGGYLVEAAA